MLRRAWRLPALLALLLGGLATVFAVFPLVGDARREWLIATWSRWLMAACGAQVRERCAPGAQALIQLLPRVLPGARVGVLGPTYEEHALSWRRARRDVIACPSLEALAGCDIGVIVNPNNPTGTVVPRESLLTLAQRLAIIVDESFADFSPQASIADAAADA
ncbi:MAG TPA: aminotransferase class I/II-fold pyridoxal phosphate-dependent enzyme, partial [Burkholderiaceae bacterium]|nr:aminotransferase class I/II-fold pyridoxal phosphate-dependent enzyme [Burkholderiaceae bacterium]